MTDIGYDQIKESREDYIINKLCQIFGVRTKQGQEKMKKSVMENEENKNALKMLLIDNDSIEQLFVINAGETCTISTDAPNPNKLRKKGVVVLKLTNEPIT